MLGKVGIAAAAVISAAIGAATIDPRELYNEMYPVEAVKRDAFHICHESDRTFIRAVKMDREACFDSMPHMIAIALGRVRPSAALALTTLLDPSRQAELLLALAAMPQRQPITVPRSFANTAWLRALSPGCEDKSAAAAPSGAPGPTAAGNARTAALDSTIRGNLPPLPRAAKPGATRQEPLPVIPLTGAKSTQGAAGRPASVPPVAVAASDPVVSDVGDSGPPAIVPLAPARNCGGA